MRRSSPVLLACLVACGGQPTDTATGADPTGAGGGTSTVDDTAAEADDTGDTGHTPVDPFAASLQLYTDGAVVGAESGGAPGTWLYEGAEQPFLVRFLVTDDSWSGDIGDTSQCLIDFTLTPGTWTDASQDFRAAGAWTGWIIDTRPVAEGGALASWTEPCTGTWDGSEFDLVAQVAAESWAVGLGPAWGTPESADFASALQTGLADAGIPWEGDAENVSWADTVLALYVARWAPDEQMPTPTPLNFGFAFAMEAGGAVVTDEQDLLVRLGTPEDQVSAWTGLPDAAYVRTTPFYGWSLRR